MNAKEVSGGSAVFPQDLLLPADGSVRLPAPDQSGLFLVTPDELWQQLCFGNYNPGYHHASSEAEAVEYVTAWRHHVIACDALAQKNGNSDDFPGCHLTNAIARVVCHPTRDASYSLKQVYRAEEAAAPREQGVGRDPEGLSIIYNSLRSLLRH